MIAVISNPGRPATLEPLSCTRELKDFPIANRPLVEWQREVCRTAGCELAEAAKGDALRLRGDTWVTVDDLLDLLESGAGGLLADAKGQILAWIGGDKEPTSAKALTAKTSFRIAYPWDLLKANEQILAALTQDRIEGAVSPAAHVEGRIIVGPGTKILPGVFIEGNVVIGANAKIGPNCYLRGHTSIGDGCHVGNAVEIKNSILLNGTAVGHLSYVGDSVLGEKVNFGAGTLVANLRHDNQNHRSLVGGALVDTGRRKFGTIVGDHVHTGINTSIYPGRKFWPKTSTRPGEVVNRDVTA